MSFLFTELHILDLLLMTTSFAVSVPTNLHVLDLLLMTTSSTVSVPTNLHVINLGAIQAEAPSPPWLDVE